MYIYFFQSRFPGDLDRYVGIMLACCLYRRFTRFETDFMGGAIQVGVYWRWITCAYPERKKWLIYMTIRDYKYKGIDQ